MHHPFPLTREFHIIVIPTLYERVWCILYIWNNFCFQVATQKKIDHLATKKVSHAFEFTWHLKIWIHQLRWEHWRTHHKNHYKNPTAWDNPKIPMISQFTSIKLVAFLNFMNNTRTTTCHMMSCEWWRKIGKSTTLPLTTCHVTSYACKKLWF